MRVTVYTAEMIDRLGRAAVDAGRSPLAVHLKVDTGMHRVGASPAEALALAKAVDGPSGRSPSRPCGPTARSPTSPTTRSPPASSSATSWCSPSSPPPASSVPMRHAANSAAAIAHPASRYDLVRCGIAVYGIPPSPALAGRIALRARRPSAPPRWPS